MANSTRGRLTDSFERLGWLFIVECSNISPVGGGLLQGIQIDVLLYIKWYTVFIIVA